MIYEKCVNNATSNDHMHIMNHLRNWWNWLQLFFEGMTIDASLLRSFADVSAKHILVSKLFFIKFLHNLKRDFIFCTLGIFAKLNQRANRVKQKQPNEWFDRSRGQTKRSTREYLTFGSSLTYWLVWKISILDLYCYQIDMKLKSGLLDKVKRVGRGLIRFYRLVG